ncbi:MAG: hypothetical protein JOY62_05955 [Acidobacteriaceae bacterium]|nr:hypothetical protein [Acidobacteriaceae bacterium]MBV9779502.1 hypothetical protein [Acidobacteriaceae bacterium]
MTRRILLALLSLGLQAATAQDKYAGPKPEKKDVPYLLHGDKLVMTEVQNASQSRSKDGQLFFVPGATSPARTPLAEPIFLFSPDRFRAEQLGLFRFEVRNGRREIVISGKRKRNSDEPVFHLSVRRLDEGLFRLESSESLSPGEYSLSPEGDNTAFCFTVY